MSNSIQKIKFNALNNQDKNDLKNEFMELFKVSETSFYKALGKSHLKDGDHRKFFSLRLNIPEDVFIRPELKRSNGTKFNVDLVRP